MKTVLVAGNFNILHPGHLRLIRFAKECGDRLQIAVYSDRIAGINAMVSENLRLEGVKCNSLVDEAFILDFSIVQLIEKIKPDVVVKGKEYEVRYNEELDALKKYGGRLIFSSGESRFSSVDLMRAELLNLNKTLTHGLTEYLIRHEISQSDLKETIRKISTLKVCVIGDLIVDEYITCDPLGMSQEDPTIVVTPLFSHKYIGGAGIVAAHAAGLGARVKLITVSGDDEQYFFAKDKLKDFGVDAKICIDETRPTTLKQRFRSKGKTLLRVSRLHQGSISLEMQNMLFNEFKKSIEGCDIIIFSDFNYGCLPQELVDRITSYGREFSVMLVADSQSSSQVGDITRFVGMDLITPTEREVRISAKDYTNGLVTLLDKIQNLSQAKNVILKMGEEGALIHARKVKNEVSWQTDQIEALNQSARDPAGAGDSMLTAAALALASGANIWTAAYLGSVAAAIQVGRIGNIPLTHGELINEIAQ